MERENRTAPTRRSLLVGGTATVGALLLPAAAARAASSAASTTTSTATPATTSQITVASGQTLVISQTTRTNLLTIASGGTLAAPSGYSLSVTVNGVETGSALTATGATTTAIKAGTYRGDVVIAVTALNAVTFSGLSFPIRQALFVDTTGVVAASSVLSAVRGGRLTDTLAQNIRIASTGEAFDGVYVNGGTYELRSPQIRLDGNGRCDFIGLGAAIVGNGTGTRLVVDGADIRNHGAVRSGVIAEGGSTVVVKNSTIETRNGVLPSDYQGTVDTSKMESVPWMLSLSGNVRATNLLGQSTIAAYVNSSVSSEGWGVLSTDSGQNCQLAALACNLSITGEDGYGSYAIGNATERFLGVNFDVGTYATINRGGAVYYADLTHEAAAALNTELALGLTNAEIAALPERPTVINSRRFGMMWHGAGSFDISGATRVNSAEATFLNKGQQVQITVDGSKGAKLNPANNILIQVMENDDPGPVMVNGNLVNAGVYTEPTGTPAKDSSFDVTAVHSTDAVASFTDIKLKGDFYNGMRGDLNLALTFTGSSVEGVISATATKHHISTITSADYKQLGEVTNTKQAVLNNGVIVDLASGSKWSVTGTSYLSKLVVSSDSSVTARRGTVSMTVDGVATSIVPGSTYSGAITIDVA
jgi:hypothetical protein